jgi:hypothetical protein
MAHGEDTRRAVRAAFVFDQLSLELAAIKAEVPVATARRWIREARAAGDDWERARSAQMIAGGGLEDVVRQTLAVVVQQVQATVELIQQSPDMEPATKVQMLASLADAYNKIISASKRSMPQTDRLGVAMDTLKRLTEYAKSRYPGNLSNLAEMLEGFGEEVVKAYG